MTSSRGRFAAGSWTIVTSPDITWKVQTVMDPMLAPSKTALALQNSLLLDMEAFHDGSDFWPMRIRLVD